MTATIRRWLCGRPDTALLEQIDGVARLDDVQVVAVMPDVHQGRTVPNGVVVATRRIVYPDLVGGDIGCGIAAIRFEARGDELRLEVLTTLLESLPTAIPTLKQPRHRAESNRPAVAALGPLAAAGLERTAAREGAYQLGTLGRGNHFLELARDDTGRLWGVVHSGSRALGQSITAHHRGSTLGTRGRVLRGLDLDTALGRDYFADMQWACRYAAANRAAMLNALADLLEAGAGIGVEPDSFIDSPHNTATLEEHGGEPLIVHRKSANHAERGRLGIVAGSMAAGSRIVVGAGSTDALASSAHGAGRILSRTAANARITKADLDARMRGIVYRREWAQRFRDEAPQAYRMLHAVMQAQRDLVGTVHALVPILNDKRP